MGWSTTLTNRAYRENAKALHARDTCQPTHRAPPGTREALVGRRGSPVASLALGPVIGQGAIAPGTEVEAHPAALPLDLATYALRALSWR